MWTNLVELVNKISEGVKPVGHQRQYGAESINDNHKQLKCRYPKAKIYQIAHSEMIYHIALSKSNNYSLNEKTLSTILYMVNSLQDTELKESLLEKLQGVS